MHISSISLTQSMRTDCNHIFLHFVPPVILDPRKIQAKMLSIVSQYGVRLYRHRVTEAEIKCAIRWVLYRITWCALYRIVWCVLFRIQSVRVYIRVCYFQVI